jgi:predicted RNA-binding protein with PUA-like domain
MAYWLMKTEPDAYSWQDLVRDGVGRWDGVRNYSARNHMRAMRLGDLVLIYHSNVGKEAVGIARVVREHYSDPTSQDDRWSCVDVSPVCALAQPVSLPRMRLEYGQPGPLEQLRLFRENRLSVVPLTAEEWARLLELAQTPQPVEAAAGHVAPR